MLCERLALILDSALLRVLDQPLKLFGPEDEVIDGVVERGYDTSRAYLDQCLLQRLLILERLLDFFFEVVVFVELTRVCIFEAVEGFAQLLVLYLLHVLAHDEVIVREVELLEDDLTHVHQLELVDVDDAISKESRLFIEVGHVDVTVDARESQNALYEGYDVLENALEEQLLLVSDLLLGLLDELVVLDLLSGRLHNRLIVVGVHEG